MHNGYIVKSISTCALVLPDSDKWYDLCVCMSVVATIHAQRKKYFQKSISTVQELSCNDI